MRKPRSVLYAFVVRLCVRLSGELPVQLLLFEAVAAEGHNSAVIGPTPPSSRPGQHIATPARWLSGDACSFVPTPPATTLLVHVGSHRSSPTPTLVVLGLSSCPVKRSSPLSDLTHGRCQSGQSSKRVLVLEKIFTRRAGCIFISLLLFLTTFQESLLGRSKTPTELKLFGL